MSDPNTNTSNPSTTTCTPASDEHATLKALLNVVSVVGCTIHGYRRNGDSLGWGAAWGIFALVVPVVPPALAAWQEFFDEPRSVAPAAPIAPFAPAASPA